MRSEILGHADQSTAGHDRTRHVRRVRRDAVRSLVANPHVTVYSACVAVLWDSARVCGVRADAPHAVWIHV